MKLLKAKEVYELPLYKIFYMKDGTGYGLIRRNGFHVHFDCLSLSKHWFNTNQELEFEATEDEFVEIREATLEEMTHFIACWRKDKYVAEPQEDMGLLIDTLRWRVQDSLNVW